MENKLGKKTLYGSRDVENGSQNKIAHIFLNNILEHSKFAEDIFGVKNERNFGAI